MVASCEGPQPISDTEVAHTRPPSAEGLGPPSHRKNDYSLKREKAAVFGCPLFGLVELMGIEPTTL